MFHVRTKSLTKSDFYLREKKMNKDKKQEKQGITFLFLAAMEYVNVKIHYICF